MKMKLLTLGRGLWAFVAALGIAATTAVPASASSKPTPTLNATSIDRFVRDYVDQTRLPGAVVAVTRGDEVVHTAGYGRTASGETMTARTRVPVASLSKAMTALAVMRLVEAGKVELDRPVHEYLPEFTMADRRARDITVRQVLTQTSGMADTAYPDLTRAQPHTLKEAVAAMRGAPLDTAPGTRYRYHNPNYFVAARLVEVVGGRPFADHLTAELFKPLGMTGTASVDTTTDMPDEARGYVRRTGRRSPAPTPAGSRRAATAWSPLRRTWPGG